MKVQLPVGRWDVRFDYEPAVIGHVCDLHRALGQDFQCPTSDEQGNCDHVQLRECSCAALHPCGACLDEQVRG